MLCSNRIFFRSEYISGVGQNYKNKIIVKRGSGNMKFYINILPVILTFIFVLIVAASVLLSTSSMLLKAIGFGLAIFVIFYVPTILPKIKYRLLSKQ